MKLLHLTYFFISLNGIYLTYAIEIPPHLKSQAKKLHSLCQKETGVAEELIRQSNNGNLPNDRTLQCYIYCLFEKTGLIDDKQIMRLESIMEILPEELHSIVENLVNVCGTKHGADGCETAYLTVKCYMEADPVLLKNVFNFIFE